MAVPAERLSHPELRAEIRGLAFHCKYDMQHSSASLAAMDATSTYYHCSNKLRRAQKQILEFLRRAGLQPGRSESSSGRL
jgi:Ser/Thr protein kinase RdoA (MazF antagonist)